MGRFLWFWVGINGAYLVMALVLLIAGALYSRSAPLVTGVIMTAMAVPAIVFGVLPALRPLMLTTEGLRIPGQFRGIREIPFERLAAVGLVYNYTPYTQRPAGWTLYVWDGDQPVAISRWIVAAGSVPVRPGSPRKLIQKRDWTMPLSHENAAYLAETRPGRIASSVFEAAVMRQGVNGPTHANAALKSVRYDPNAVTRLAAWWSPDGEMGRAAGIPPVDPAMVGITAPPMVRPGIRALALGLVLFVATCGLTTAAGQAGGAAALGVFVAGLIATGACVRAVARRGSRRRTPATSIAAAALSSSMLPRVVDSDRRVTGGEVPQEDPQLRNAQRRATLFGLVDLPLFVAIALLAALLLGRSGHLSNGQMCAAVLGSSHVDQPPGCAAWRHHHLVMFLVPAAVCLVGIVLTTVLQVRALRAAQRMTTS